MPKKNSFYVIESHINDLWENNLRFWNENGGKVKDQMISTNGLYRTIKIRHKMSMKAYGSSSGENYFFDFAYDIDKKLTYITLEIKFNMFGKGAIWKIPIELMKKWAKFMGIEYNKLVSGKDPDYQHVYNEINNLRSNKEFVEKQRFCPYCGFGNSFESKKCSNCNSKLTNVTENINL